MSFKLTISRKISLGFGLFIFIVAIVLLLTTRTLNRNIELTQQINVEHTPALSQLNLLKSSVQESAQLIEKWIKIQSDIDDDKDKLRLLEIMKDKLPAHLLELEQRSEQWEADDKFKLGELASNIKQLLVVYEEIRSQLPDFDAYYQLHNITLAEDLMDYGSDGRILIEQIFDLLDNLILKQQEVINKSSFENEQAANDLKFNLRLIFILVLILGIMIAYFTIQSIVSPIKNLRRILLYLGKGVFPKKKVKINNDEIGEMAFAVNRLVAGLKRTTEFANQVGSRNFDVSYEPLSDEDELGRELLKMRDDLAENERYLEQKVEERTNEVVRQKVEIENQKEKVYELYKDLTDSINYAKRLQQAILPSMESISQAFPESFVLFRPKSIVSGDFYWLRQIEDKFMFSVVDCTGHGVPGAFMSLVGYNAINQAVKTYNSPELILNEVNKLASDTLNKESGFGSNIQDGMDMSFCVIDSKALTLEFAGAYNPAYIIRDGDLIQLPADKMAIGSFSPGIKSFTKQTVQLKANDHIYLFSDGYADQFGGPKGKKFMKKRFRELLMSISDLPLHIQQKELYTKFINWQDKEKQVDDICVFGLKITADAMSNQSN